MSVRLRTFSAIAAVCLSAGLLSLVPGCGTGLLTDPPPVAVRTAGNEPNTVLVYECFYRIDEEGKTFRRVHTLSKVGMQGMEGGLSVSDGSVERLTAFEARVLHADRSKESYSLRNMVTVALSSKDEINRQTSRVVSLKGALHPGDLIEEAMEHEILMPQLGLTFSPAQEGDEVKKSVCAITIPVHDSLAWQVVRGGPSAPVMTRTESSVTYTFEFPEYSWNPHRHRFERRNKAPTLYATVPTRGMKSWKEFGDWYLGEIQDRIVLDSAGADTAHAVVAGLTTDREKMCAIATYCQKNVRYESVGLDKGEFIPNKASSVLQHRFGDCKDYSTLMVAMARAVNLTPELVLCFRGTGREVCSALPVSQFNHAIVHFRDNGKDLWFDGTNPVDDVGIPDDDLVNNPALVLSPGNSTLVTINGLEENLVTLSGTLRAQGNELRGHMTLQLFGQHAIGFHKLARTTNPTSMETTLIEWLQESLAANLLASALSWHAEPRAFVIEADMRFPAALWNIGGRQYVRFDKLFSRLLPQEEPTLDTSKAFYYPGYPRVQVSVSMPDFVAASKTDSLRWGTTINLPQGPFDSTARAEFLRKYSEAVALCSRPLQLSPREGQ